MEFFHDLFGLRFQYLQIRRIHADKIEITVFQILVSVFFENLWRMSALFPDDEIFGMSYGIFFVEPGGNINGRGNTGFCAGFKLYGKQIEM